MIYLGVMPPRRKAWRVWKIWREQLGECGRSGESSLESVEDLESAASDAGGVPIGRTAQVELLVFVPSGCGDQGVTQVLGEGMVV